MKSFKYLTRSLAAVAVSSGLSHAAISITFDEVGTDVVATYSGSVDLNSMDSTSQSNVAERRGYDGDAAYFQNTAAATLTVGITNFAATPSFVTATGGDPQSTTVFAGDDFGLYNEGVFEQIYLPADYISGTEINGSLTFEGTDIATLGLNPGSYLWTWQNTSGSATDSATITVVPEPSTLGLAGLGLMGILVRRRR